MKTTNNSIKENDYSLHNSDNYYKNFNCDAVEILHKYVYLINEFLNFILEKTKIKNNNYAKFIIIRGYDTVTNVFNTILYYTKNLNLSFYHCQKSYYYYIEFIEQISYEEHTFLQLSSRDATTYVYRKTLIDLNHDFKKNMEPCSNEIKNMMQLIDEQIKLFKLIFDFILEHLSLDKSLNANVKIINIYQDICVKITDSNLKTEVITLLYKIIENINKNLLFNYNKKNNTDKYLLLDSHSEILLNILKNSIRKTSNITFWKMMEYKSYNDELLFLSS
jgi:hypothetical protein